MKQRIFISAVTKEFGRARVKVEHVLEFLGYEAEHQDIFGTEAGDLRDMLRRKIDSCDGLIQIVGFAYGTEPPTSNSGTDRQSYTQFELTYARETGKTIWIILADKGVTRDTLMEDLDLPPAHLKCPDPRTYQLDRQHLQQAYREKLEFTGALYWRCHDDMELENIILKIKSNSLELRNEFRAWQQSIQTGIRHISIKQIFGMALLLILICVTVCGVVWLDQQRRAAQLADSSDFKKTIHTEVDRVLQNIEAASKETLLKEQSKAATQADAEERQRSEAAAAAEHQTRLTKALLLAKEMHELEKNPESSTVTKKMIEIAANEGVANALAYLDSHKSSIINVASSSTIETLRPLLMGAEIAEAAGDIEKAQSYYSDLEKIAPEWMEAKEHFWNFLTYTKAPHEQRYNTLEEAEKSYKRALIISRALSSTSAVWMKRLYINLVTLAQMLPLINRPGILNEAAEYMAESKQTHNKAFGDQSNKMSKKAAAHHCFVRGDLFMRDGNVSQAAECYQESLKIHKELLSEYPGDQSIRYLLAHSLMKLGDVEYSSQKYDKAAEFYSGNILSLTELLQEKAGEADRTSYQFSLSLNHLDRGRSYLNLGKMQDAKADFESATGILRILESKEPANTTWQEFIAQNLMGLTDALRGANIFAAKKSCLEAIAIYTKLQSIDPKNYDWKRGYGDAMQKFKDISN